MNMRCFNPQFFIGSRVGDVAIENERAQAARIDDRRIDVLIEAVNVLAATVPAESLTPAEQLVLEQLRALRPAPSTDQAYVVPRRMALWRSGARA